MVFIWTMLSSYDSYSQMESEQNFENLNRDSIIHLAINELIPIIEKKGGDRKLFDANIYTTHVYVSKSLVIVRFILNVKYLPLNSSYYGNMFVDLKSNSLSIESLSNTDNKEKSTQFYLASPLEMPEVKFVINVIQKWGEFGDIMKENFSDDVSIYEQADHYKVTIQSESYYSSFKIKKEEGEIFDDYYEQLEPFPENEADPLVEITKWPLKYLKP